MFNWLGTWLGNWFGSSEPAPVGAMSGSASFSLSTSATLTSTGATTGLMMGAASLSISTTATGTVAPVQPATGNFWSAEFWADGFWSYGFWGVFEQPYTELKPNLKLFVRTELHKLFVQFEVEQIIAVAELNSLSVLRAASALSMQTGGVRTVFASQMAVCLEAPKVSLLIKRIDRNVATSVREVETVQRDKSNRINALMRTPRIDALTGNETIYIVQKRANEQVVGSLPNTVFAHRKRETLTVGDSAEMIVCNT